MQPRDLYFVWQYNDVDRAFWREHLEDWLPQRVFDAHQHVFPAHLRQHPMTEQMRRQAWVNELTEPIDAPTAQRCIQTVLPGRQAPCLAFGMPDLDYDLEGQNEYVRSESGRRGWVSLSLLRPEWSAQRLAAELDQPGVIGVKPYYTLIARAPHTRDRYLESSIFDFLPRAALDVLNDRGSWVTLHVPRTRRLAHPQNLSEIREIRRRYPRVILVIAHLGRCYTEVHARQALPALADDPGLYFDNAAVLNPAVHRLALECLGPHRILYGSDNPVFYMRGWQLWEADKYINHTSHPFHFNAHREPPRVEATYTLFMYEALRALRQACQDLGLSGDAVRAVLHDNAQRLVNKAQDGRGTG
jgi:predicted TIM-barrel fold metal-dependent hydrolase